MGVMKRLAHAGHRVNRTRGGGTGTATVFGGSRRDAGRFSGSGMGVGVTLSGGKRTEAAFATLDDKTRRNILRKSMTVAGREVRKAVKQKTPRKTGLLRRSLGTKLVKYQKGSVYTAIIGQAGGLGKQKGFSKAAARAKTHKKRGGLSGEGVVLPLWLVNSAVQRHAMPGPKRTKRDPSKPYVFTAWGQVNYRKHIPNHPGHRGAKFIERGARASQAEAAAAFRVKFKGETSKALRGV